MKTFKNFRTYSSLILVIAGAALLQLTSCSKDDPANPQDDAQRRLISTWTLQSAKEDGVDKTQLYKDMTITFNAGTLTTKNNQGVWRASDTWQFASDDGKSITRGDGVTMTITQLTDHALTLTFTYDKTTYGDGRVTGTAGQYEFTFTK